MADTAANLTTLSNLFKYKYDKKAYAVFNTATPLLAKIKRVNNFKGKSMVLDAVTSFTGSVGAGTLPETSSFDQKNPTLARVKLYGRMVLDREALIASQGNDAAFEDVTKRQTKKLIESFVRNTSRALFATANGRIATGDGSTNVTGAGTSGDPYIFTASATGWVKGHVEKYDKVNIGTETTILEITAVNYTTRAISLVGTSSTLATAAGGPSATSAIMYMQNSKDADLESILRVCKATSSTLYGVDVGHRWQAAQVDASSAGVSVDLVNQLVSDLEFQYDSPDLLVTSYKQLRKIKNLLGDKLRYCTVNPRDPIFKKAGVSFQAVEWNTEKGPVALVADRMCPDDHLFALNTNEITLHQVEAPKWFDEDGSVLMRKAESDAYEARYGVYGQLFVHPNAQGVLYGLA